MLKYHKLRGFSSNKIYSPNCSSLSSLLISLQSSHETHHPWYEVPILILYIEKEGDNSGIEPTCGQASPSAASKPSCRPSPQGKSPCVRITVALFQRTQRVPHLSTKSAQRSLTSEFVLVETASANNYPYLSCLLMILDHI